MNPNGRPTVLDHTRKEIVYSLLRVGSSQRTAAAVIGVSEATIRYAKKHDPEFAQRVAQSVAMLEVELLVKLRQNAGRSWKACTYALEKLCPDRYGKPEKPDEEYEQEVERELADMEAAAELEAEAAAQGQPPEEPKKPDENDPIERNTRGFGAHLITYLQKRQLEEQEKADRERERFMWARKKAQAAQSRGDNNDHESDFSFAAPNNPR